MIHLPEAGDWGAGYRRIVPVAADTSTTSPDNRNMSDRTVSGLKRAEWAVNAMIGDEPLA